MSDSLRVNQNIGALLVHHNLVGTSGKLGKSLERLASGLRINRSSDDAAGLALSEKLRAQVRGLDMAVRNTQDGISILQVAESALASVSSILQRLRELAVQGANDTWSAGERSNIKTEIDQLVDDLNRVAANTEFNNVTLLDGSIATTPLTLQVGANAGQVLGFTIATMDSTTLKVHDLKVDTAANASTAISSIDAAIDIATTQRADKGAVENRLEQVIFNLTSASQQQRIAESRIRDLDVARETIELVRQQILQQTGVAALAQANVSPRAVLALFA